MYHKSAICHPERGDFARGLCKNCYDKWLKENNPEYVEKQRKNRRDWYQKYKTKVKAKAREYGKARIKEQPEYNSIKNLKKYGLTLEDYDNILTNQNGVCAICGNPPKNNKKLHIDHDHKTGEIRGLLCFRCNFGLSWFEESVERVYKAYEHLNGNNRYQKEGT